MIRVWRVSGQELTSMAQEQVRDVGTLKGCLSRLHGFPPRLQQLLHDGRILEDAEALTAPVDVQLLLKPILHGEAVLDDELFDAIRHGHVDTVRVLLTADVHNKLGGLYPFSEQSRLALVEAVDIDSDAHHVEIVRALLEAAADANLRDRRGKAALTSASQRGHLEIVQLLLQNGAAKDMRDSFGSTALILASSYGHLEVVRLLLQAQANLELDNNHGENPLLRACTYGHLEVARALLEAGADKGYCNRDGDTPLGAAAFENWVWTVRIGKE
ncbi:TANC2 [Symbiodinium natans]|uniref:TANC2 protein n=1 Tax=Symbiodinium natans TaxID=878477 RepID=A0A812HQW4_9DINO|nr:TANC2 [Symbiodinium natans]